MLLLADVVACARTKSRAESTKLASAFQARWMRRAVPSKAFDGTAEFDSFVARVPECPRSKTLALGLSRFETSTGSRYTCQIHAYRLPA